MLTEAAEREEELFPLRKEGLEAEIGYKEAQTEAIGRMRETTQLKAIGETLKTQQTEAARLKDLINKAMGSGGPAKKALEELERMGFGKAEAEERMESEAGRKEIEKVRTKRLGRRAGLVGPLGDLFSLRERYALIEAGQVLMAQEYLQTLEQEIKQNVARQASFARGEFGEVEDIAENTTDVLKARLGIDDDTALPKTKTRRSMIPSETPEERRRRPRRISFGQDRTLFKE